MQEVSVRVHHSPSALQLPSSAGSAGGPGSNGAGGGGQSGAISLTTAARGSRGSRGSSSSHTSETSGGCTSPMDLSSGGGGGGGGTVAQGALVPPGPIVGVPGSNMRLDDHRTLDLLTARKLAEFVKAQQFAQQMKQKKKESELEQDINNDSPSPQHEARVPKKRPWDPEGSTSPASSGDHRPVSVPQMELLPAKIQEQLLKRNSFSNESTEGSDQASSTTTKDKASSSSSSLIPLELIRAKWEQNGTSGGGGGRSSPESAAESYTSSNAPLWSTTNNEVKKRRLDALLSSKFAVTDSPPSADEENPNGPVSSSPEEANREEEDEEVSVLPPEPVRFTQRRPSNERKANRRKQSNPTTPSPPAAAASSTLSLRPNSELYNPPSLPASPLKIQTGTPSPRSVNHSHPSPKTKPQQVRGQAASKDSTAIGQDMLKSQILQLQLAQAALLSNAGSNSQNADFLKSTLLSATNGPMSAAVQATNPLLYYGYHLQMLQGLQQAHQNKMAADQQKKQSPRKSAAAGSRSAHSSSLPGSPVKNPYVKPEPFNAGSASLLMQAGTMPGGSFGRRSNGSSPSKRDKSPMGKNGFKVPKTEVSSSS